MNKRRFIIYIEQTERPFCVINYFQKQLIKYIDRKIFFRYWGLLMPKCRSLPFLSEKQKDKKEMEETLWQKSITFTSEDKR